MDITDSALIGTREYEDWKRITELEAKVEELSKDKEKTYKAGYIDGWHEGGRKVVGDALDEIESCWKYFQEESPGEQHE